MTAAKPLYTTHGIELFERPDGRVYGYRGSTLVGATWPIGDVWWAQQVGEPEPHRLLTRHAGIAYFVGGCPDCVCDRYACEHDDSGTHCEDANCGYCLNGCSAGECPMTEEKN
jgi:hypothetical protein